MNNFYNNQVEKILWIILAHKYKKMINLIYILDKTI